MTGARWPRGSRSRRWPRPAPSALLTALLPAALTAAGVTAPGATVATAAPGPPPVTVLTPARAGNGDGDIFIAPFGDTGTYANGPEIITPTGRIVWFHAVPAGQEAAGFRTRAYRGRGVLTWWQGTGLGGLASGTDSAGPPLLPASRSVTVRLDYRARTATLVAANSQPEG